MEGDTDETACSLLSPYGRGNQATRSRGVELRTHHAGNRARDARQRSIAVRAPMEILREVWYRVSARSGRGSLERQLDEEMEFHRDMLSRDNRASGMTAGQA